MGDGRGRTWDQVEGAGLGQFVVCERECGGINVSSSIGVGVESGPGDLPSNHSRIRSLVIHSLERLNTGTKLLNNEKRNSQYYNECRRAD